MLDMPEIGRSIHEKIIQSGHPEEMAEVRQVLALVEEIGEFAEAASNALQVKGSRFTAAYRRWAGMARRTGTRAEMELELADIILTAYVTAAALDINIEGVIEMKLDAMYKRGWRDDR